MEAQTVFDTKPLLRPAQIDEAKGEIRSAEAKLQSPHIEDKAEVAKQLRRLNKVLSEQTPLAPTSAEEEGRMVGRSSQLLNEIMAGMPSQEEMRKAPPGAVDKHIAWERRNKLKILEWKNLQLRLTHSQEPEAANLERHRPVGSSLSMDNAFIPGKQFYLPPQGAGLPTTFTDEQLNFLRQMNPAIADVIATLNNQQRAQVKTVIEGIGLEPSQAVLDGRRGGAKRQASRKKEGKKERQKYTNDAPHNAAVKKKSWTPEERKAFGQKMKAARAKSGSAPE